MEALPITPTAVSGINFNFKDYLEKSLRNPFVYDFSEADLKTIIKTYIKVKREVNPKFGSSESSLLRAVDYIESRYGMKLYPVQITDIFWTYFVGMMQSRGLKNSTIITISNQLRTILRWAQRYNAKISPSFDMMRIPKAESIQIALTADEVSRIYYFDIDLFYANRRPQFRQRMHQVRDMFVLSCNLYQRHSDMVRIDRTCFNRNIFQIIQQKTGNVARVDIDRYSCNPRATYAILEKYDYKAPYSGDISNYNHYLKTLMRDIGFTEEVRIEERIHGQIQIHVIPKWKMISSHTARRTSISIAVLRGESMHKIKIASGHSGLNMLEHYVKE